RHVKLQGALLRDPCQQPSRSRAMPLIPLNLEPDPVQLPAPLLPQKITLNDALKRRRSTRSFVPDPISMEVLSALLWSAFGVNREQQGGRTAPSARDGKEVDVYAVLPEGAYRYEPRTHRLLLINAEDLRDYTGMQDFVAGADTGFIAQNVYLYCAA